MFAQLAGWPSGGGGQSDGRLGELTDGDGVPVPGGAAGEIICANAVLLPNIKVMAMDASAADRDRVQLSMKISSRPSPCDGCRRRESLREHGRSKEAGQLREAFWNVALRICHLAGTLNAPEPVSCIRGAMLPCLHSAGEGREASSTGIFRQDG